MPPPAVEPRDGREREQEAADGKRGAAAEGHEPVHPDEDSGRGEAVQEEEGGHRRERGAHDDRAAVLSSHADDRQGERGCRGGERAAADGAEMKLAAQLDVPLAEEGERKARDERTHRADDERGCQGGRKRLGTFRTIARRRACGVTLSGGLACALGAARPGRHHPPCALRPVGAFREKEER